MSKVERTFSTKVRVPYQDAIGLILHMIDYHYELMRTATKKKERNFQEKQARRLKAWLEDQKDWIHQKEGEEPSVSQQLQDELEPIIHSKEPLFEIEPAREPVTKRRILEGPTKDWSQRREDSVLKSAEKSFFKGEKWEWKNEG